MPWLGGTAAVPPIKAPPALLVSQPDMIHDEVLKTQHQGRSWGICLLVGLEDLERRDEVGQRDGLIALPLLVRVHIIDEDNEVVGVALEVDLGLGGLSASHLDVVLLVVLEVGLEDRVCLTELAQDQTIVEFELVKCRWFLLRGLIIVA